MNPNLPAILGVMVPILAIVMGLGLGMLVVWFDFRKKREMFQLHHAERMAAIEKGVELPPLPPEFFGYNQRRNGGPNLYFRRGVMWLLVGAAILAALRGTGSPHVWWGLVPVAVGVAYLLSYLLERRQPQSKPQSQIPPPEQRGGNGRLS